MKKPEVIHLTDSDAFDAFAPEPIEHRRFRPDEDSAPELDVFQSEVFAGPMRQSVRYRSRTLHPAALVALAAMAAVIAVVLVQRPTVRLSLPTGSVASAIFESSDTIQPLPPVKTEISEPPTSAAPAPIATPAPAAVVPEDPPA